MLALCVAAASAVGALLAVVAGFGLRCDESCEPGGSWRDDPDAWQWQLLEWTGIACLVAAIVLVVAVAAGLRRLAVGGAVLWSAAALVYGLLISDGLSVDSLLVIVLLLGLAAATCGSVALSRKASA